MDDAGPARVLVAEDETDVRWLLRVQLELAGYQILEASDGAELLAQWRESSPDLVLLDLDMPVMDGFDVLRVRRIEPGLSDVPVIVVTAFDTPTDVVTTLELGAIDHIRKPFHEKELLARIAAALRTKQDHDALRGRNAALETASRTDHLTGLVNRGHLDHELRQATAVARRYGRSLAVAFFDVDDFKMINDRYGHAAGDTVLREIARRLAATLRAGNIAGRWGGEEFVVLLPDTSASGSRRFAERVRKRVEATPVLVEGLAVSVTVSCGCAASREPLPGLLRRADRALYEAKSAGRNRVVLDVHPRATAASASQH